MSSIDLEALLGGPQGVLSLLPLILLIVGDGVQADFGSRSSSARSRLLGPPDAGGPPPSLGGGTTDSITSRDTGEDLDEIRTAIQALQLHAEGNHDDVELAKVHKCIVALQSILADHAKNRDAAMGTTPAMKHVRRTTQGGATDGRQAVRVARRCPGDVE